MSVCVVWPVVVDLDALNEILGRGSVSSMMITESDPPVIEITAHHPEVTEEELLEALEQVPENIEPPPPSVDDQLVKLQSFVEYLQEQVDILLLESLG